MMAISSFEPSGRTNPSKVSTGPVPEYGGFFGISIILLATAFLLRMAQFGNPVIQIDEQFYLLVGDRMLQGLIPFVDVWDRKPIGLFALYALIRMLGGVGILQYQIVATLFAAGTAMAIVRLASRVAGYRGALLSGVVYLVYLMLNGGDGGQSPVFYNLPVALAVFAALKAVERDRFDGKAFGYSTLSMALFGVALQIKYSPVFEGVYVGLFMLGVAHRGGISLPRLAFIGLLWCALALAPTALVAALYWRMGYLPQFVFANFVSILIRPSTADLDIAGRLFKIAFHIFPVAIAAMVACRRNWRDSKTAFFVAGWATSAVTGLLIFGTFHDHYALPLLVPLSVAAAPMLTAIVTLRRRTFRIGTIVVGFGVAASAITIAGLRHSRGDGTAVRAASALVNANPPGSIFVFNGDPIAYLLTRSPLPTPYAFPTLLSERRDASSMGVDQMTELKRTMATLPAYVFTRASAPSERQQALWDYMNKILSLHYAPVFVGAEGNSTLLVYKRRNQTLRHS